ncbi:BON domain-containing protein [Sphaerotilus montanus]|jgi:osmotically-inducible protein OsmY|uniref:Osmotically-inducible protein OsmY n=1 Tax=Sphaerotilus montanus TaxID=522889 RepID=A0A7Y9QZR9_9BURK|nr:BON domain-containing protein [Sphaerotilus montanus]NYG33826.1 osmotically-inducible protein OsmY [Sphaerotilus montanus]NZD58756.1 BON domain-containing protein [Sphaerotilus montanus]
MALPLNHTRLSRPLSTLIAAAALCTSLAGCAPLLVGGAAVGGAMVVTDRRSSGVQLEDETIELKAGQRIRSVAGERSHVNVTSYQRQVLLTGEVYNEADKAAIEAAIGKIDGVKSVVNDLAVMWPSSTSERSRDLLLVGKIKATFVDAAGLASNAFTVVAERGVVYLMGRVTEEEATRAIELARAVPGTVKVVRLVDVITPEQLRNIKGR